jgi:hypothetical protein
VAGKRQHVHLKCVVCLNCHRLLSNLQARWQKAWKKELHVVRCIVQGVHDVVQLWLERSPVVDHCRALLALLAHAALCLLPHLRPAALADLTGVVWGRLV